MWTNQEKELASAVWAQDVIVGAVLDELEALAIEKETVVFFSGDNVSRVLVVVPDRCSCSTLSVPLLLLTRGRPWISSSQGSFLMMPAPFVA
jgi:hypothetical protein